MSLVSAPAALATTGPPSTPTAVATRTATDGVALTWSPPADTGGSAIVGYDVFRGTAPDALAQIGFANSGYEPEYADRIGASTSSGTTYYYAVRAVNETDTGSLTTPVAGTTPATVVVPSSRREFALEGSHSSPAATDASYFTNGNGVTAAWQDNGRIVVRGSSSTEFTITGADTAGTYSVSANDVNPPTAALCDAAGCDRTGSVVINQLDSDSADTLVLFSADITMDDGAIASIRYGTDDTVTAVSLAPVDAGTTTIGATVPATATYTNVGDTDTTIGTVSVVPSDGTASTDWSTAGNDTCTGAVVPAGGTCTVGLSVTPTAAGARTGELVVTDDSPAGTHERALTVLAKTAPIAPAFLRATRAADGTVTLLWEDDGGQTAAADSFTVSVGTSPDNLQPLTTQPANTNTNNERYTDPNPADGMRYYSVTGTNIAGTGLAATLPVDATLHPPTHLVAGPVIHGVVLSWAAPAGYPAGQVTYDVYLAAGTASLAKFATTTATSLPVGLATGLTFHAAVLAQTAVNGDTTTLSPAVTFTTSAAELVVTNSGAAFSPGHASLTPGAQADIPLPLSGAALAASDVVAAPNGMHIAYTTPVDGTTPSQTEISIAKSDGTGTPIVAAKGTAVRGPAWSLDGSELAYQAGNALSMVDASGRLIGQVSNSTGLASPTWVGPQRLVAVNLAISNGPLVEIDTQTGARATIANSAGASLPVANPAGTAVAYQAGAYVWVTTLSGTRHAVALPGFYGVSSIAWSRDQSRLYVATHPAGSSQQIWSTLSAGGGTPVQITDFTSYSAVSATVVAPDTTPPTVSLAKLPAITLTPSIRLTFSGRDAVNGIRSYDVRYTRDTPTYRYPVYPVRGATGTTATSVVVHLVPGGKYCFSVRATDRAGNVSAWTKPTCTVAPFDERGLHKSAGFGAATGAAYYLGTVYSTTRYGEAVWAMTSQPALYLVATTCATCGSVEILEQGRRVGVISLHSTTTVYRRVLPIPPSKYVGELVIRVATSGKRVLIDGLVLKTL
jgi:hypothetical protein